MLVSLFTIYACKGTYLFCNRQMLDTIFLIVYYEYGYKKNELEKKSNSFFKTVGFILTYLIPVPTRYRNCDSR